MLPPRNRPLRVPRSQTDLRAARDEGPKGPSHHPRRAIPAPNRTTEPGAAKSNGLPAQRVASSTQSGSRSATASQQLRPAPPRTMSTLTSSHTEKSSSSHSSRKPQVPPPVSKYHPKASTHVTRGTSSKGELHSGPLSRDMKPRTVPQPAISRSSHTAIVSNRANQVPNGSHTKRSINMHKNMRVLNSVAPASVPLPPSPEPVKTKSLSDQTLLKRENSSPGSEVAGSGSNTEDPMEKPCAIVDLTNNSSMADLEGLIQNEERSPQSAEEPPMPAMAGVTPAVDEESAQSLPNTPPPTTPVQVIRSTDHAAYLSAKTPISALLDSIQQGFILSPSSPLSHPQIYLEERMPEPCPLNLEKGSVKPPFLFGRLAEGNRQALNSLENTIESSQ
jgi:hypothetical protein